MPAMAEPSTPLDVTVVTGMSGAGRSATADVLEDLGFFVIDNLPPALIPKVAELGRDRQGSRFGLVVDTRAGEYLPDLESALAELRETGARTRVLFLDAADEVLVRRFDETRRRHPVAESHRVSEGIARERELLEEIKGQADIVIDTSELNVHELRDRLREIIGEPADMPSGLQINVVSFGYKHGLPLDVDLVFDCRFLPNPHWIESLRPLPGTDAKVRRYVMKQEETQAFLEELSDLFELLLPAYVREGKSYLSIGVGCTGGRHRSVVIAAEIARLLERLGFPARVHHRDLERE
jgi:RNase adapter protein RapZ